jgi:hypothetical protein
MDANLDPREPKTVPSTFMNGRFVSALQTLDQTMVPVTVTANVVKRMTISLRRFSSQMEPVLLRAIGCDNVDL